MTTKTHQPEEPRETKARLFPRISLSLGAILVTLVALEIGLRILGIPQFLEPHSENQRFAFTSLGDDKEPFYLNSPGRITFRYDGNPRGYFDDQSQVHHDVNPTGFRGPAFTPKPEGTRRLIFLGDSFTFGEGVRNEDTYGEVTARLLRKEGHSVESCNLGVGGYNTTQEAKVLKTFGFDLQPDVVVLGYTLNDAEPPLIQIDPASGKPIRRAREANIEAEAAPQKPPTTALYRLRLAQMVWHARSQSDLSKQTVDYYLSINDSANAGRIESERALRQIITQCRERNIPCIVVMFPLLHELSDNYPFTNIHRRTGEIVEESGGHFIDLLPALMGQDAHTLIVHPTDQHPNEVVHAIVGKLLAEEIARSPDSPFKQ